jgi:hypothetical protein
MFEGLKRKIALNKLKREFKNLKRVGKVKNLDDALSVGIIYHLDREDTYHLVKKYVRFLKEQEGIKKIMALAFIDAKEMPPEYQSKLEFDFFTRKDLSRFYKPGGTTVKNFIGEDYDILIDLTHEINIPLRYILNYSRAKFKVGYYSEANEPFYDLMINMKKYNMIDYIDQVNHYLKIINTKK